MDLLFTYKGGEDGTVSEEIKEHIYDLIRTYDTGKYSCHCSVKGI